MQRATLSLRCLVLIAAALGAVACSSGGSSSSTTTGQFIDSPVQGLRYVGDSFSGVTDADGRYAFNPGDQVCFYLGQFELGCTDASGIVTPLDLLPGYDSDDDPTLNMVRLFMSLDADGDPSNGLDVSNVSDAATGAGIDFVTSLDGFENDADVQNFVAMYGPEGATGDLVDAMDAEDHFQDSLEENDYFEQQLVGTWLYTSWDEGMPTVSESFTIALGDLEVLDADVQEDGEVTFTRVQNDEDCVHSGDLNGRRPRILAAAVPNGDIPMPIPVEGADMIFGSIECGEEGFQPAGIAIPIALTTFRMDELDGDVTFEAGDLYGFWYLMAGEDSRPLVFEEDEPEPPIEIQGVGQEEEPQVSNEIISEGGAVSFSLEHVTFDEQTQEEGFEECSYQGQMSPDKYFMSGNFSCPSGQGGVWTAEMGYF